MLPLLTKDSIDGVCAPYISAHVRMDGEEVRKAIDQARQQARVVHYEGFRARLKRLLQNKDKRAPSIVRQEYDIAYADGLVKLEKLLSPARQKVHFFGSDTAFLAASGAIYRSYMYYVKAATEATRPLRILEVGSGSGKNLLALAAAHPGPEYVGLEYSENGVALSRALAAAEPLPFNFAQFSGTGRARPAAFDKVSFEVGNAASLPFPDGSFDLVFTMLALEQMRPIIDKVIPEIRRVCRGHVLFIEPFLDANEAIGQEYIRTHGYFDLTSAQVSAFGFKQLQFATDVVRKPRMSAGVYFGHVSHCPPASH